MNPTFRNVTLPDGRVVRINLANVVYVEPIAEDLIDESDGAQSNVVFVNGDSLECCDPATQF